VRLKSTNAARQRPDKTRHRRTELSAKDEGKEEHQLTLIDTNCPTVRSEPSVIAHITRGCQRLNCHRVIHWTGNSQQSI